MLQAELGPYVQFSIPKGGMAVWVRLHPNYSWAQVAKVAGNYKLELGKWQRYDAAQLGHNGIRMGFAAYTEEEIRELIRRLRQTIEEVACY